MAETYCIGCGQAATAEPNDAGLLPAYCARCFAARYGADESHEKVRLFQPAPTQIPGQSALDV